MKTKQIIIQSNFYCEEAVDKDLIAMQVPLSMTVESVKKILSEANNFLVEEEIIYDNYGCNIDTLLNYVCSKYNGITYSHIKADIVFHDNAY